MKATEGDAPVCLPPRRIMEAPRLPLLPGTCDTHFHVFRAGAPLAVPRSYTPQVLTLADWYCYADAVNISRGVLVQPSVYGFDNDVLLDALSRDPACLRGVAVVRPEIFDEELRSMDRLGVRGVRVNTRNKSGLALSAIPALASKLAKFSWLLQLQVNPDQLTEIAWLAARLEMPVVLDHLGFIPIGRPDTPRWVGDLQRLLDTGNCYVKLSAPYRLTNGPPYAGFGNVVRQLAKTHADRLLWGSDWPHTELFGAVPDDAELVDFMQDWLGSEATQHRVFVANPEALFFSR